MKSGKSRNALSPSSVRKVFDIERRIVLERSNISVDADGVERYPLSATLSSIQ